MKAYIVTSVSASVIAGLVVLSAEQARARAHKLIKVDVDEETGNGLYEVNGPIMFKRHETFGSDQDFSKAGDVRELTEEEARDAMRVAARAKPARRGRKPKEPAAPASSGAPPAGSDSAPPATDAGDNVDGSGEGAQA